jgi:hypothetical protein
MTKKVDGLKEFKKVAEAAGTVLNAIKGLESIESIKMAMDLMSIYARLCNRLEQKYQVKKGQDIFKDIVFGKEVVEKAEKIMKVLNKK